MYPRGPDTYYLFQYNTILYLDFFLQHTITKNSIFGGNYMSNEFIRISDRTIIYDGVRFTKVCGRKYYYNTRVKRHLHQYVWEKHNKQRIPQGYQIHHINHDTEDNDISNLQLLKREEHLKHHGKNMSEERREQLRQKVDNIRPLASEWHGSEEGREWHKEHYENMKEALYVREEKECEYCGNVFDGLKNHSRFCSNNCKSSWRRKAGLDDEVRICAWCGKEFLKNKYSKAINCGRSCGMKYARNNNK